MGQKAKEGDQMEQALVAVIALLLGALVAWVLLKSDLIIFVAYSY